ncbi:MAG: nucleoside deaminase [Chromatiaceae bacterium]|nr:MAG: nucleoside deaminase [Chromatiaceae bacterium]
MQTIRIAAPSWLPAFLAARPEHYVDDAARMRLALDLARANIRAGTGGPFGAAVFAAADGRLLAAGMNLVSSSHCALAHAEMVALAAAQQALRMPELGGVAGGCILASSAEPCAMCLGALPWSGISRLVCGARDEDIRAVGFDEGDKPPGWPGLLARRGIGVVRDLGRDEAMAILNEYAAGGGMIYGPRGKPVAAAGPEPDETVPPGHGS